MPAGKARSDGACPPAPAEGTPGPEQGSSAEAARALAALEAAGVRGESSPGDLMVTAAAIRDMAGSAAGALAAAVVLAPARARPALGEAPGLAASAATSAGLAWRELGRLRQPAGGARPAGPPGQAAAAASAAVNAMAALESGLAGACRLTGRPRPAAFPGAAAALAETLVRLARVCDQLGEETARPCPAASSHLAQAASFLRAAVIEAVPGPAAADGGPPCDAALPAGIRAAPAFAS